MIDDVDGTVVLGQPEHVPVRNSQRVGQSDSYDTCVGDHQDAPASIAGDDPLQFGLHAFLEMREALPARNRL
jgi:hypothetical protein